MRRPALTLRLAFAAGLWVVAGLGSAGWFVAGVMVRQIEATFDARLAGLLDAVAAAAAADETGRIALARAPAGADFERPFSGAYWQVSGPGDVVATSRSLWDQTLPPPDDGHEGVLYRDTTGPRGLALRLAERDILLPGAESPAHVAVALAHDETAAEIRQLRRVLLATFALLGVGLVAGVVATVVAGLAPLRRVRGALAEVRQGQRERLGSLAAPAEIAPLVEEVDALIAANRATVERARTHLGNLAHALKTPLAVLRNALDAPRPDLAAARAEAGALERLVHHHLARARAAARAAAGAATAPLPIAEEVASALRRLFASRGLVIAVAGDAAARVQVDPQDLTEMLGNLMENACQWAATRIDVAIAAEGGQVTIAVADDGPGLSETERHEVLGRGVRLDERRPGTGLGLAIVADLAALHEGTLALEPAERGGLLAVLSLPQKGVLF